MPSTSSTSEYKGNTLDLDCEVEPPPGCGSRNTPYAELHRNTQIAWHRYHHDEEEKELQAKEKKKQRRREQQAASKRKGRERDRLAKQEEITPRPLLLPRSIGSAGNLPQPQYFLQQGQQLHIGPPAMAMEHHPSGYGSRQLMSYAQPSTSTTSNNNRGMFEGMKITGSGTVNAGVHQHTHVHGPSEEAVRAGQEQAAEAASAKERARVIEEDNARLRREKDESDRRAKEATTKLAKAKGEATAYKIQAQQRNDGFLNQVATAAQNGAEIGAEKGAKQGITPFLGGRAKKMGLDQGLDNAGMTPAVLNRARAMGDQNEGRKLDLDDGVGTPEEDKKLPALPGVGKPTGSDLFPAKKDNELSTSAASSLGLDMIKRYKTPSKKSAARSSESLPPFNFDAPAPALLANDSKLTTPLQPVDEHSAIKGRGNSLVATTPALNDVSKSSSQKVSKGGSLREFDITMLYENTPLDLKPMSNDATLTLSIDINRSSFTCYSTDAEGIERHVAYGASVQLVDKVVPSTGGRFKVSFGVAGSHGPLFRTIELPNEDVAHDLQAALAFAARASSGDSAPLLPPALKKSSNVAGADSKRGSNGKASSSSSLPLDIFGAPDPALLANDRKPTAAPLQPAEERTTIKGRGASLVATATAPALNDVSKSSLDEPAASEGGEFLIPKLFKLTADGYKLCITTIVVSVDDVTKKLICTGTSKGGEGKEPITYSAFVRAVHDVEPSSAGTGKKRFLITAQVLADGEEMMGHIKLLLTNEEGARRLHSKLASIADAAIAPFVPPVPQPDPDATAAAAAASCSSLASIANKSLTPANAKPPPTSSNDERVEPNRLILVAYTKPTKQTKSRPCKNCCTVVEKNDPISGLCLCTKHMRMDRAELTLGPYLG